MTSSDPAQPPQGPPTPTPIKSDLPTDNVGKDGLLKAPLAERLENFKEVLKERDAEIEASRPEPERRFEKSVQTIEKELGDICHYFIDKDNPFNPNSLVEMILTRQEWGIVADRHTQTIFFYCDTSPVYHKDGDNYLHTLIKKLLGSEARGRRINEVIDLIRFERYATITPSTKISVENGTLDINTCQLEPFSKYEFITNKLSVAYNPEAKSEAWEKFVDEVCPDDKLLLQEWSGYLLCKGLPFHAIMWLYGPTSRNGKGAWARTIQGILGAENYSNIPIHSLDGSHRFATYNLKDTLVNICSEPRTDKPLTLENLQSLSGEDSIDTEKKGVQEPFKMSYTGKITVMGNQFPTVERPTDAFWQRLKLCKFPNQFIGAKQIQDIEQKWLSDPEQRSAILNWMIAGYKRLIANHGFTMTKTQEETIIQFKRASDTIGAFFAECLFFKSDSYTPNATVSDAYKGYCDLIGITAETINKLNDRLENTPRVKRTSKWEGIGKAKKKVKVWQGIEIKPLLEDEKEEDSPEQQLGTDGTVGTTFHTAENPEIENNREYQEPKLVPSVPVVPDPEKSALGDTFKGRTCSAECLKFRTPACAVLGSNAMYRPEAAEIPCGCSEYKQKGELEQ